MRQEGLGIIRAVNRRLRGTMITVKTKGNHDKTKRYLKRATKANPMAILQRYGEIGLEALQDATPRDTGLTANSWYYEIAHEGDQYYLNYFNSNIQNGIRIAVILDLGHGTGTGGYVQGKNYIKPAIRPIFDQIANAAWKEVTDA